MKNINISNKVFLALLPVLQSEQEINNCGLELKKENGTWNITFSFTEDELKKARKDAK